MKGAQKKLAILTPFPPPHCCDNTCGCFFKKALAHPYVAEFHNPDEEPVYPYGPIFINLDDNVKLSAADYRDKLYREISKRKKETRRKSDKGGDAD